MLIMEWFTCPSLDDYKGPEWFCDCANGNLGQFMLLWSNREDRSTKFFAYYNQIKIGEFDHRAGAIEYCERYEESDHSAYFRKQVRR